MWGWLLGALVALLASSVWAREEGAHPHPNLQDQNDALDARITALETPPPSVNNPPVAVDDGCITDQNTPVFCPGALLNDSDSDGDALSPMGIVTPTMQGGSFAGLRYTPPSGFNGDDSTTHAISGGMDTAQATINIAVKAPPPPKACDLLATTQAEFNAILAQSDASLSGQTVCLSPGNYNRVIWNDRDFSPGCLTLASQNSANPAVIGGGDFSNAKCIVHRDLKIWKDPNADFTRLLWVRNVAETLTFERNEITMEDPTGVIIDGEMLPHCIGTTGGPFAAVANFKFIDNEFHHCKTGIDITANDVEVLGNVFRDTGFDAIYVRARGSSGNRWTVSWNVFYNLRGDHRLKQHGDFIQWVSANHNEGDISNLTFEGNIMFHGPMDINQPSDAQGIFLDDFGSHSGVYRNVRIAGNVFVGSMGIGLQILNGTGHTMIGNTVLRDNAAWTSPGTRGWAAHLRGSAGTVFKNNVASHYVPATIKGPDNVLAEWRDEVSPNSYSNLFARNNFTTVTPGSVAELLTMYAMKPNGPLDADNSGGPSLGDIGAIGTGYVTWPTTIPGHDGSLNADYE